MAFLCAPLNIKYFIYVYLAFKFIISEVVSLKKFGPVSHPIGDKRVGYRAEHLVSIALKGGCEDPYLTKWNITNWWQRYLFPIYYPRRGPFPPYIWYYQLASNWLDTDFFWLWYLCQTLLTISSNSTLHKYHFDWCLAFLKSWNLRKSNADKDFHRKLFTNTKFWKEHRRSLY